MSNLTVDASACPKARSRSLICTSNAIWFWPGVPLSYRRGGKVHPVARHAILQTASMLHGPEANFSQIVGCVENAARLLNVGELDFARAELDRALLPPVSADGAELVRAVSKRLLISSPSFEPSLTSTRRWSRDDVAQFAKSYDRHAATARSLEKAFSVGGWNETKHPRWPKGQPDGGEFKTVDAAEIIAHLTPIADEERAQVQLNRDRHERAVKVEIQKYRDAGFKVTEHVRFFVPALGYGVEVDFVVSTPGFPMPNPLFAVDVKTGKGGLTDNQDVIYPKLQAGVEVIPRGVAAFEAGFVPAVRAEIILRVDIERITDGPDEDAKKIFTFTTSREVRMPYPVETSIVQNVRNVLMSEGFEKPLGNMQIRPSGKEWRGWISIDASAMITVNVGVFSVVVRDALYDVLKSTIRVPYGKLRKYRIGPPNVMLPLSMLIDPDPRAQTKMPWAKADGKDPAWVEGQMLDAIRTCAYPFYERTFRYEALLEAAMRYSALNQAQQYSTPILMLLAGRRDRWGEFTDLCLSHMSGTIEEDYRRYLAALEPYLRQKGLLPS